MILENRLGVTSSAQLAVEEERITKARAAELFDSDMIRQLGTGTFAELQQIHRFLFRDIYDLAGQIRTVNMAKGTFRFVPVLYLENALTQIERMPQATFDQIIEKYVEMNIAHPFREGNGRSMRLWLDFMLRKELAVAVDWSMVDKELYLFAMERSPVRDTEIKELLRSALTDSISSRDVYMKGLDASYNYEGFDAFAAGDIAQEHSSTD